MGETITVSGITVHPSELERIVKSIDGVSDCVVVGIEHEIKGEVPHALIVKGKQGINDCKIMALTNGQLPRHKQLGGVTFIRSDATNYDNVWTYAELKTRLLKTATFLRNAGFMKGDVCAIAMPNCFEFLSTALGAWCAGMVVTGISPDYTHYEMTEQLDDSGASIVFATDRILKTVLKASEQLPRIRKIVSEGGINQLKNPKISTFREIWDLSPNFDPYGIKYNLREDLVTIPYSSGTTGKPKGVMCTQLNLSCVLENISQSVKKASETYGKGSQGDFFLGKAYIALLPLYHVMGLHASTSLLCFGQHIVVMPKFNLKIYLKAIEKFRVERLLIVPTILQRLDEFPTLKSYDLSSVNTIMVSGGASLQKTKENVKRKLNVQILQSYGMSEVALGATKSLPGDPLGASGKLQANMELKVIDSTTGEICGPMVEGELRLRGPTIMRGYLNRPEESASCFDEDGFFKTGDRGYFDHKGYIYFGDRQKDLIKVNGRQVSPAELEEVILEIPGIRECIIIGIPDEKTGELPYAYVVLENGSNVTADQIAASLHERVAQYKRLAGVTFLAEIPKNAMGKSLRRLLPLYLIAAKSSNLGGKYSYFLFSFCVCSLILCMVDFLIVPTTISADKTYIILAQRTFFGHDTSTYILLLLYLFVFSQTIVSLMLQFLYRYSVVCRNSLLANNSGRTNFILCIFASISICTIWTLDNHIFTGPQAVDEHVWPILERVFYQQFERNISGVTFVSQTFEAPEEDHVYLAYVSTLTGLSLLVITWTVIMVSGLLIYQELMQNQVASQLTKHLQRELFHALVIQDLEATAPGHVEHAYISTLIGLAMLGIIWAVVMGACFGTYRSLQNGEGVSKKTKQLQRGLFYALVIQMLIPLFCNFLPLAILLAAAMFELPSWLSIICLLIPFDPILEPIAVIYFIKCYRKVIISWVSFGKPKNVLQIQHYSTESGRQRDSDRQTA
ncbi:unnamed protein product, partial [Mesorhabditis spiculigera]